MAKTPVAIVTGASRGIGAAIAARLASDGFAVVVNYLSDEASAERVVATIENAGGQAKSVGADVSNATDVQRLFAAATAMGQLRTVVNNSGVLGPVARLDQHRDDEIDRLLDVNLRATLLVCRSAVEHLSTARGGPGGAIVNIASLAARTGGVPGLTVYAATKGAVVSFTRGLASEVAEEGIRVNSVSPGTVATDMFTPGTGGTGAARTPMGRPGLPSEIAAAVAWLASPESSFVTGADITVSGGR